MRILSGECATDKPIIDVALAAVPSPPANDVQAAQAALVWNVTNLKALLDTGADGTSISRSVVQRHTLISYGKRTVVGVGGPNIHDTWATYLGICYGNSEAGHFPPEERGMFVVPNALMAVEIPDNQWFDMIIGRDVLTQFDFSIRRGGHWELKLC